MKVKGSIPRKMWENLDEEDFQKYVTAFTDYYREYGFPYHRMTWDEREKDVRRNLELGCDNILENNIIKQNMRGLGFCWTYHPHAWEIKCGNGRTPMEVYSDYTLLRKTIEKRMRAKWASNMSPAMLYKSLRIYNGVQAVSNFRPTAAAAIYKYASKILEKKITTWDMSAGFGGRMYGALISGVVEKYIGTDPSEKTFNGLVNMQRDLKIIDLRKMDTQLHRKGSEVTVFDNIDLCMTSPPYFDTEKYDGEEQSYIKYPEYKDWSNNFLKKTLKNCWKSLKKDGLLIINVKNTKTAKNIEDDMYEYSTEMGFYLINIMELQLSGRPQGDNWKYEPIYVFKKPK